MLNKNYFATSTIAGTSKRFPFVVTAKILGGDYPFTESN